jgi:multisubunit Na+/H+ antiporter MnhF subunit
MNAWLWSATVLVLAMLPCLAVAARGSWLDAFVALEATGVLGSLVLLLLAQGFARGVYFSLALVFSIASLVGGLVFARFLERWL